jgi:hypothetical protein
MNEFLLPLHLLSLAYSLWNVILADHMGFLWMRGKTPILNLNTVRKRHVRVLIGLTLMLITGFSMFWPMRDFLIHHLQFQVKMLFVLGLIINSFVIGKFAHIATEKTFASLSTKEKIPLLISGVVSTMCWLGAIAGGIYLI